MSKRRRRPPTIDGIPDPGTLFGEPPTGDAHDTDDDDYSLDDEVVEHLDDTDDAHDSDADSDDTDSDGPVASDELVGPDAVVAEPGTSHRGGERPRRSRRSSGRRTAARRKRRRRAVLRSMLLGVLTLVVGVAAVVGVTWFIGQPDDAVAPVAEPTASEGPDLDPQPTVVLATFDETDPNAGASLLVVLAYERESEAGTVLFVPAATVAEIPGHGLLPIGRSYGFGQGPLLDASVDNLLGVDLDQAVGISRQGWAALFTRIGGLTIDVPERLDDRQEDGSAQTRFLPGEQFLDGPRVAELLTFREANETELEVLPRAQRVIQALLDAVAEDPSVLDPIFVDGAPMLDSSADRDQLRGLLTLLAGAAEAGDLEIRTLPVSPIGSSGEDSYRVDEARADPLVASRLGTSVPTARAEAGRDLQILNGNGVPGIGQRVAEKLVPAGFRVVHTRNADRFDHETTKIIIFDDSAEQLAIAEEIRDLLGLGTIERTRVPQSVADVTVVVGLDFLERR